MTIFTCNHCGKTFSKPHNPNREYKFCSYRCRATKDSIDSKILRNCLHCGEQFHPSRNNSVQKFCSKKCAISYKDLGKTTIAQRIRASLAYEDWRKAVFERDLYTCQICGEVGGKLNADHIKRFADYPKLRLELSNGRTLCEDCHKATETYGNRNLKRSKLIAAQEA